MYSMGMSSYSDRDFLAARREMLSRQLAARGIDSLPVLKAMAQVPRERFVGHAVADLAYSDQALAIDCGQTISQPYMVALMTQALELSGTERVLEIGTGSGYQTAVLCELAQTVVSIERHPALSHAAGEVLRSLGYRNVKLVVGDGMLGWPPAAPYDRILVTAAPETCPPALWNQLSDPGILVLPVGERESQQLLRLRKRSGQQQTERLTHCRFVPLVSGVADDGARRDDARFQGKPENDDRDESSGR